MRTKPARKTLSWFLAVCMAMTILPMAVFAETEGGDLDEAIVTQTIEAGANEDKPSLPDQQTGTGEDDSVTTPTVSGEDKKVSEDHSQPLAALIAAPADTPKAIEITGFEEIPEVSANKAGYLGIVGDVIYSDVGEVILALPKSVTATLSNGSTVSCDVTSWIDTDDCDLSKVGSYTFTAQLDTDLTYANNGGYEATVEVVVIKPTTLEVDGMRYKDLTKNITSMNWHWDSSSASLYYSNDISSSIKFAGKGCIGIWGPGTSTSTNIITLTLAEDTEGYITFGKIGNAVIEVNGTPTVNGSILCRDGLLTIKGSGALTLNNEGNFYAIEANKGLTIKEANITAKNIGDKGSCILVSDGDFTMSSGKVSTTGGEYGIKVDNGVTSISGTANVSTTSAALSGIYTGNNMTIAGTPTVTCDGGDNGTGILSDGELSIAGGQVTTIGGGTTYNGKNYGAIGAAGGITVTGGTLTVGEAGESAAKANVGSSLSVSDSAQADIYGSILNQGDLTVSGGTVNIAGEVSGETINTGGTLKPMVYTAKVNITLNNTPTSDARNYILRRSDDETITFPMEAESNSSTFKTANVSNGTWKLYVDDVDTGVQFVINNAAEEETLKRYTVNPGYGREGTAYNDYTLVISCDSTNGFSYYNGQKAKFTITTDRKEANYSYLWSGTHNGTPIEEGEGSTYEIPSVEGQIIIKCTVTGTPKPITQYVITLDVNGGNPLADNKLYTPKTLEILPTPTRSGSYIFDGWYTAPTGGTKVTTTTEFKADTTLYARWMDTSGSGSNGGGSSGDNSSSGGSTATSENKQSQSLAASASVTATIGQGGVANATISEQIILDAIAKLGGKTTNAATITLNVAMPKEATSLVVTLSQNALDNLMSAGITSLKMNSELACLEFDLLP